MTSDTPNQRASRAIRWLSVAFVVVFGGLLVEYTRFYASFPYDDAYIFMRIARRFAEQGAPYFNAGDPVMGHSSHLWLWLLTALFRVFGAGLKPVIAASATLLVVSFVLASALLARRWREHPLSAVLASAAVTLLFLAPISVGLMETPLAVATLLATMLALDAKREGWAGFFAGLSFLTRYELALAVIFTLVVAQRRRDVFIGLALPVVAFLGFTSRYYGTMIPQTMLAKRVVYSAPPSAILESIAWIWDLDDRMATSAIVALVLLILAGLVWTWRDHARSRWPAVLVLLSVAIWCVHLLSHGLMFPWYWALATFPLGLGLLAAARRGRERLLALGMCLCLGPLTFDGVSAFEGLVSGDHTRHSQYQPSLRVVQYLELGRHLREGAPDVEIMTNEIGGLGWALYPNRVLDGVGLVTPDVLKYHPMRVPQERGEGSLGCIPPKAVVEHQPAIVVSLAALSAAFRSAVKRGAINNYVLTEQWAAIPPEAVRSQHVSDNVFGGYTIDVYARQPAATATAR